MVAPAHAHAHVDVLKARLCQLLPRLVMNATPYCGLVFVRIFGENWDGGDPCQPWVIVFLIGSFRECCGGGGEFGVCMFWWILPQLCGSVVLGLGSFGLDVFSGLSCSLLRMQASGVLDLCLVVSQFDAFCFLCTPFWYRGM